MTPLKPILVAAALALAMPAFAQTQAPPSQMAPDTNSAPPPAAPSATMAGVNTSGPVPADQLPPGQASALAAGDNQMVTNGPVPDTRANRAKYGRPMSNAGRKTKPAGN
jgi:hypothetical protein